MADSKHLQFLATKRQSYSSKDALGMFVIATMSLHFVVVICLILLYGSVRRIADQPPPSLVQLASGKTISAAPLPNNERSPEVIKRFVTDTLTSLMSWSGQLPSTDGTAKTIPDQGIEIKNGRGRITTPAWHSSFALSEDFRKEFLQKLSELTPQSVFSGQVKVVLVPLEIQPPIKVDEGKWRVVIVANLIVLSQSNNLGDIIPFNKEIFVQAVEAPNYENFVSKNDNAASIIAAARASGLEIYAMRDLRTGNL